MKGKPHPLGPTPDELVEQIAPTPAPANPYIRITLQDGPVGEVGVNGAQIDDVIAWCRDRLLEFNSQLPDVHTGRALNALGEALHQLDLRTIERTARGVEGTSRP